MVIGDGGGREVLCDGANDGGKHQSSKSGRLYNTVFPKSHCRWTKHSMDFLEDAMFSNWYWLKERIAIVVGFLSLGGGSEIGPAVLLRLSGPGKPPT